MLYLFGKLMTRGLTWAALKTFRMHPNFFKLQIHDHNADLIMTFNTISTEMAGETFEFTAFSLLLNFYFLREQYYYKNNICEKTYWKYYIKQVVNTKDDFVPNI